MQSRAEEHAFPPRSASSPGARLLYAISIPGCGVLLALHGLAMLAALDLARLLPALIGLLLGVAVADGITGMVHWACDSWGSHRTPWLGESLIQAFRAHHRKPTQMLEHDWIDVNGGAAAAAFAALLVFTRSASFAAADAGLLEFFGRAFFVALLATSAAANQLHYWAHDPRPARWVRSLQRMGILLSRVEHARHHRAPHTHGYCISTGWLNRPLDALHFWRVLEAGVTGITGVAPRTDTSRR